MDTEFKKSKFNLLVLNIIHSVESAYRKAIQGKTAEIINSSRIFTQSDITGNRPQQPMKKRFHLFKPNTW